MSKFELKPEGPKKTVLSIKGAIDEDFDLSAIDFKPLQEIDINLLQVSRMNSRGLRAWLRWMATLDRTKQYTLIGCPHIMVSIAGLVADLFPKWMHIQSLEVPFVCEECGHTFTHIHKLQNQNTIPADLPQNLKCEKCGAMADIGVSTDIYFRFLTTRK